MLCGRCSGRSTVRCGSGSGNDRTGMLQINPRLLVAHQLKADLYLAGQRVLIRAIEVLESTRLLNPAKRGDARTIGRCLRHRRWLAERWQLAHVSAS